VSKSRKKNKIVILKLGGSLITEKNQPFSLNEDIIQSCVDQIIENSEKLIVVHGGGSFGHPTARKYKLREGKNDKIESQVFGVAETHFNMTKLNSFIISKFLEKNYSTIEIQSSSIFRNNSKGISEHAIENIERFLNLGITPILYGDIVLDEDISFSILSGDEIIYILCKNLINYKVSKVVFAADIEGIYVKGENKKKYVVSRISSDDIDNLQLADMGTKIDVTEGIHGKLAQIKKIAQLGIPIEIINGTKPKFILKSLKNEKIESTYIEPSYKGV